MRRPHNDYLLTKSEPFQAFSKNEVKISVVLPTFNRANLVSRAIKSVLAQSHEHFELIIVDDCSDDHTEEVVDSFTDPRIRYMRHGKNMGGSAARNTGIKAAAGDYIAFLDSDDEWLPQKLEKQLAMFRGGSSKLGAVGSGRKIQQRKDHGYHLKEIIPCGDFGCIYRNLLTTHPPGSSCWPGGTQAIMIKKECFEKVGLFDESLMAGQEHDLYIRLAKHYHFDVVREPLLIIHLDARHRISTDVIAQIKGKKAFLEKYARELPRLSRLKGHFNYVIGTLLLQQDKRDEGRKHLFRAVASYPFRLKYWVNLAFSFTRFQSYYQFKRTLLRNPSGSRA